ncbi:hypothetical protein QAD02_005671 [Eretmocerus hayati]|uniref:Uncharacterized protein n=1 Tax=Eretmocerus hayati TaxID=131215 RepID=A0ACC2NT32_9HYME|nr:hypothetical protein QAD02_005671 [Eretmocerus hayati]
MNSTPILSAVVLTLVIYQPEQVSARGGRYPRVAGGVPTSRDKYPYIVSLGDHNGIHFCAGTVLSKIAILTAAHCTVDWPKYQICISTHDPYIFQDDFNCNPVTEVIRHENYESRGDLKDSINDIAIIRIERPLNIGVDVEIVKLTEIKNSKQLVGDTVTGIGYGAVATPGQEDTNIYSDLDANTLEWDYCLLDNGDVVDAFVFSKPLRHVNLTIISRSTCVEKYEDPVHEGQFCAYAPGKGQCFKDSGGPLLLLNGTQVGIFVSYKKCGSKPGLPCLYTDISKYRGWINRTMKIINGEVEQHEILSLPRESPSKARSYIRSTLESKCTIEEL